MKLIITSFNRAQTIKTPFLEVFQNYEKILLLHNEEQRKDYLQFNDYKDIKIIVTGIDDGGKAGQIKYAVDNILSNNEWAIFADDNIDFIYGIDSTHWKNNLYLDKSSQHWGNVNSYKFDSRLSELITKADEVNAHLIGFLSTNNYYFARKKYKYYGFCHGKLTLWKKDNDFVFDNFNLRSLNDFHFTAMHLYNYGIVLINDYMHPKAKYFQKGGIGSKKARKPDRIKNINLLLAYYPELIKTKKRTDNYPDVRIAQMSYKNFIIWRYKYKKFREEYAFNKKLNKWERKT